MEEYLKLENIFLYIAAFSTLFYIIKLCLFMFTGGDVEVHTDFTSLCDTDISFNFLSIQSILAFLMGFGWVGLAMLTQFQFDMIISLVAAFLFGLLFMFLSAYLMFLIKKLDKNVKIDMQDFVGTTGRAYTAFKPHSKGQIEITINDQLSVIDAVNMTDEDINAFMSIKIEKVEDNVIYIVKI